jgi:hypothetical protein
MMALEMFHLRSKGIAIAVARAVSVSDPTSGSPPSVSLTSSYRRFHDCFFS